MSMRSVTGRYNGPELEQQILEFWRDQNVFKQTLEMSEGRPLFTFNEGPPTANGKPGIHHVLARSFKDVFPRYKTMQGYHVPRKAGWDTHGLPVEHEIEKELGIFDKKEIETIYKKAQEAIPKLFDQLTLFQESVTPLNLSELNNDSIRIIGPELIFGKIFNYVGFNKSSFW